jgi:tetratricopeptide (TPR) repeat protein
MLGLFRRGSQRGPAPKHATPDSLLAGRVVVNGVRIDAQLTPPYLRAISLHNECHCLAGLRRWEEGLARITQAVGLRRRLADARPEVFAPDLANSLNAQSTCLANLGRHEQALASADEAVAIYRQLSDARPAFRAKLALSLNNQSICLGNLGHHDEALKASEEAVAVYRDLGETAAGPIGPELSKSLGNLATALDTLGRHAEAAAARAEAGSSTGTP